MTHLDLAKQFIQRGIDEQKRNKKTRNNEYRVQIWVTEKQIEFLYRLLTKAYSNIRGGEGYCPAQHGFQELVDNYSVSFSRKMKNGAVCITFDKPEPVKDLF